MKVNVSTSLEDDVVGRIQELAEKDLTTVATILRKCIVRSLPQLEREILGEQFVVKPEKTEAA
jgi:predicted transcriptional regulator